MPRGPRGLPLALLYQRHLSVSSVGDGLISSLEGTKKEKPIWQILFKVEVLQVHGSWVMCN
jgi:hypothetical protein